MTCKLISLDILEMDLTICYYMLQKPNVYNDMTSNFFTHCTRYINNQQSLQYELLVVSLRHISWRELFNFQMKFLGILFQVNKCCLDINHEFIEVHMWMPLQTSADVSIATWIDVLVGDKAYMQCILPEFMSTRKLQKPHDSTPDVLSQIFQKDRHKYDFAYIVFLKMKNILK